MGGGGKTSPCLKLVRIARNLKFGTQVPTYVVLENIAFSTKTSSILLMPAFLSSIFRQNSTFTESSSLRAALDCSDLSSVFVRQKVTINENLSFTDHASGIQLPDCSKLVISQKFDKDICRHDVITNFLTLRSLIKFSYWSKFHASIMTGSGVTIIFVYNGLARNRIS